MDRTRAEFAAYLTGERGLRRSTAFTYETGLRRIEKFIDKRVDALTVTDVRNFLRKSSYHPATKSATLVAVKAFHRFGHLEGWWDLNGIMSLQAPRQSRYVRPALSQHEARLLLDACETSLEYRLVYLGLFAGLRVSDSARLTPANWIHTEVETKLQFLSRKSGRNHEIPLHPELADRHDMVLARYTTRDSLKSTARSLSHCLGIRFTSHTLRRTFARRLLDAGVQEGIVSGLLDHAPQTVLRSSYADVEWHEKVAAIARLSY